MRIQIICNTIVIAAIALLFQTAVVATEPDWFVDVDVPSGGAQDGTSWPNAFNDLQSALDAAEQSPTGGIIWLADGSYTPDASDPGVAFELIDLVAVYGGFQGNSRPEGGETTRSQRDPQAYVSTLTGDLGGGQHSWVVVSTSGTDTSATLDGFTVTGAVDHAIYNENGSPTLANLRIVYNQIEGDGAGM